MKWVWPLNWHFRIRELERQLATERAMNRQLELSPRAANLQNTMITSTYSAALMSIAGTYASRS